MQVWIDGDACPTMIKEILFRAAVKRQVKMTVVANSSIWTPPSPYLDCVVVPSGANVADRRIVELCAPGDLVVTADIPLAADVVAKGAVALDPRGQLHTPDNIGARLASRNLNDVLRGAGQMMGGPSNFNPKDKQAFANQLDRWLAKVK